MKTNENLTLISILAVLSGFLFYAYEYILRIIPSIMAPQFSAAMHVNLTTLGALGAYYYFAYTPMQLVVGIMLDRYELKKILTLAALACTLGTVLISISNSTFIFGFGRFIQGCGSAFAWVGIIKLAAIYVPKKYYGLATSLGAVFGFVGAAFGQALLGYMVSSYGNSIALTLVILVGIFITYFIFNELSRAEQQNIETENKSIASTSFKRWLRQFIIVLKTPYIWAGGIIAALLFTPTTVFAELWGIKYLTKVYAYSEAQASFISSMVFIGWAIGAAISGVLTVFTQSKIRLIRYGSISAFAISFLLLYVKLPFEILCFISILFGICSSVQVLSFTMGRDVLPAKLAGITGALINLICVGIGVCFQRLAGTIIDIFWSGGLTSTGLRTYSVNAYKFSMLIIPLVLIGCFLFTFILDEKKKKFKFPGKIFKDKKFTITERLAKYKTLIRFRH
ncbi:MAG: transporter [Burkholderiales bacterium]|jgi:MFS family permease|nr:transporter [Burkholderiales bacterium]